MSTFEQLLQFLIHGISIGAVYGVVGIGFMIVVSVTRILNFTQGESVMLGGMVSTVFYPTFPLFVSVLFAVVCTTFYGMIVYRFVIYPIRKAPVFSLILATFGASIVTRGISLVFWGTDFRILPTFFKLETIRVGAAVVHTQALCVLGATLLIGIVLYLFFGFTVSGRAFRASAINVFAATLRGIRTDRMGVFAFMLASSIGGLSGAVLAPMMCTSYEMGLGISIKGFFAGIIGGLNRIEGIIAGGLALGILESYGAGLIHSGFKDAIPLLVFLVVLYFRRGGLLGGEETGRI